VALVIPLGVIGVFWLLGGCQKPAFPIRPLVGGGIFLALVLPWYIALYATMGPAWIIRFFWDENLLRFTTGDFGPQRGVLYYPGIFLGDFFPWCLLSVGTIWYLCRIWRDLEPPDRDRMLFLLAWILFPMIFFSFSKNKQEYYIMSVYPAAALALGILMARLEKERILSRYWRAVLDVTWASIGILVLGIAYMIHKILGLDSVAWSLGALILAVQLAGWLFTRRDRWQRLFVFIPISIFLVYLVTVIFVIPKIEEFHPIQRFARIILAKASVTDRIGSYDYACPSLCFYTLRPIMEIVKEDEIVSVLAQPHPIYCVLRERNLAMLDRRGIRYRVIDNQPLVSLKVKDFISPPPGGARNRLLLIVNTPPEASP
jgi:4-amino-4-deoxy-L-arabinose transferase